MQVPYEYAKHVLYRGFYDKLEVFRVSVLKEVPQSIVWVGAGSIMSKACVLTISHGDMMGQGQGMGFAYMQSLDSAMARIN